MKIISSMIIFILMISCLPEDTTPTMPTNTSIDISMSTLIKQGVLNGVNHMASGTVYIYETKGSNMVYFSPFSSEGGPDLKVYLSKDAIASEYLRLGPLQSTSGMQAYAIPSGTNIGEYSYVHIWCEKYSVEFARAEMK